MLLDRYGLPTGRYVFAVPPDGAVPYPTRSLPYVEDPGAYHLYELVRPLEAIPESLAALPAGPGREEIEAYLAWWGSDLAAYDQEVPPAFGDPGGAVLIELPLPVELLERLGVLIERTAA